MCALCLTQICLALFSLDGLQSASLPDAASGMAPTCLRPAETHNRSFHFETLEPSPSERGIWKCDPVLADVNGDNRLDLAAIPRLGHGPHVWLNDNGRWRAANDGLHTGTRSCGGGVAVADVNSDGFPDLVAADHCQGIAVFAGDGTGYWEELTRGLAPDALVPAGKNRDLFVGAECLAVADLDDDGHLDIVAGASDDGGINIYRGDSSGNRWQRVDRNLPHQGWVNRIVVMDIDDDGRLDIAATHGEGPRVWLQEEDGRFVPASEGLPTPMVKGLYYGLAVGDVNGDRRVDLVVANWIDGPEVYHQESHGVWSKAPDVFPDMQGGAVGLVLGDVNGDRHLDIVLSGRLTRDLGFAYGVFVLTGDGQGAWRDWSASRLPRTGMAFTFGAGLGDVNKDGLLDIAVGSGGAVAAGEDGLSIPKSDALPIWLARRR